MRVKKVILINCGSFYVRAKSRTDFLEIPPEKLPFYYKNSQGHLGLVTIRNALNQQSFNNVEIFPYFRAATGTSENVIASDILKKLGVGEGNVIIGLSTNSNDYQSFVWISKMIRKEFAEVPIVAGGPHFKREKIEGVRDSVEVALQDNLADAVVVGHAQPFVELIIRHMGNIENVDSPGFYRIDRGNGNIYGNGYGTFPDLELVPWLYSTDYQEIFTMWDDTCHNRCGFCSIPKGRSPLFPASKVINTFTPKNIDGHPAYLGLTDSNPFEPGRIGYYQSILENLPLEHYPGLEYRLAKTALLDPSLIVDLQHREVLLNLFQRFNFQVFFIGRETAHQQIAKTIGSNYRGRPKNQSQLDSEREALVEFIRVQKQLAQTGRRSAWLTLSYLFTPFETAETAAALCDDMEMFISLSSEQLEIATHLFPIIPLPGTKLRRTRIKDIPAPEDYGNLHAYANPWDESTGPLFDLFDYI